MSVQGALSTVTTLRTGVRQSRVRAAAAALVLLLLASISMIVGASPAHAAARVDVSPNPNADGSTTVTLSGSGFQYQPNAPGGVYVFFGAVSDPSTNAWAPSQGGKSGETFSYAATNGARLLIAFQGGASADAANGMIGSSGSWSTQMTIPGAKFTGTFGDPHSGDDQTGTEIDCLQVQCGIITIGAHGMVNANNESFTPVSFETAGGEVRSGTGSAQEFGGSGEAQSNDDEATKLDVPGGEEGEEAAAEEAAPEQPQEADAVPASADSTLTWIVLGVLGFAVLALIVAIVLVLVKRSKAKKAAAAAAAAGASEKDTDAGPAGPADAEAPEEARPADVEAAPDDAPRVPEEANR